jgi:hypothetical protein
MSPAIELLVGIVQPNEQFSHKDSYEIKKLRAKTLFGTQEMAGSRLACAEELTWAELEGDSSLEWSD